jgi:APA family basic amino acid/polyamine antiporter
MKESPKYFVREATGLVREFSFFDLAAVNFSGMGLFAGLTVFLGFTYLFPNANLPLAMLITLLAFIPLGVTYAMNLVAMPRSGGDYVFISRVLHPSLGLMLIFTLNIWFAVFEGAFANWLFTVALAPSFSIIGSITNFSALVNVGTVMSRTFSVLIGGYAFIIVTGLVTLFSPKWTARLIAVSIVVSLLGLLAIGSVFLTTSNTAFQSAFNSFSLRYTNDTNYYQTLIQTAQQRGLLERGGFSWSDTLGVLPFAAYSFIGISEMQALGGEAKNPKKTAWLAIAVTIIVGGSLAMIVTIGYLLSLTPTFYNAVNFDYYGGFNYLLPFAPNFNVLASLATTNVALLWLMNIGYATSILALQLMYYLFFSRYFLAASFDRVFPEKLSAVSTRYHSPYVSLLLSIALVMIIFPLYTFYGSLLATESAVIGEIAFGYAVFGLATIFFPFSKHTKSIFENSPIRWKIIGIPVITLLGVLNVLFLVYLGYVGLVNPVYGVSNTASLIAVLIIALFGPVWYFIRRLYLKEKLHIDLDLVFSEIPPE